MVFILFNERFLELQGCMAEVGDGFVVTRKKPIYILFKSVNAIITCHDVELHDFSKPAVKIPFAEGLEKIGVYLYLIRGVEGSQQVLETFAVQACFSTDAAVACGEQCRWKKRPPYATVQGVGNKSRDVLGDAASDGNKMRIPF